MTNLNVRNLPVGNPVDKYKKIGMLTPSSNSTLEPVLSRMTWNIPEIVCLYSRIPVSKISLKEDAINQFDKYTMLKAAELLADAEVDVIAWNGTSGSWLGLDRDREICELIKREMGIPATTSMLATFEAFKRNNVKNTHIIAPYIKEVMECIIVEYEKEGITVVNADACGVTNVKFMRNVSEEIINSMMQAVTKDPADAISVVCTAFPLIHNVDFYEKQYGYTIYDSINVVLWETMLMVGVDPSKVKGWGRVFETK